MSSSRVEEAYNVRTAAAELARLRPVERSVPNGDEKNENQLIGAFTKGMRHNNNGEISKKADFRQFVAAGESGDPDVIKNLNLGPKRDSNGNFVWRSQTGKLVDKVRGWESLAGGLTFDLQGPDPQSVSMPPAPKLESAELTAEMAELYLMALARDIPISGWGSAEARSSLFDFAITQLNSLDWFKNSPPPDPKSEDPEIRRGRSTVTLGNIFRGILPGSEKGPFLSQFLIAGTSQIGPNVGPEEEGIVRYGAITIDQRVRIATTGKDYLTEKNEFLDVQDGADFRGLETYQTGKRLIRTIRDLCTWVHFDALYQPYLNACLIMLGSDIPLDPSLPFQGDDADDKHIPFITFGPPHVLAMLAEVSTRALKAVKYQKFNIHRRARPEAIGGLINEKLVRKNAGSGSDSGNNNNNDSDDEDKVLPELDELVSDITPILERVRKHNRTNNMLAGDNTPDDSYFLPMAYAEGSPMHPSYGSGHATVAGACTTILKAFFDTDAFLPSAYEVDADTGALVKSDFQGSLNVADELNKLADNISIARNMAGVHYFTDAYESVLLGEKIAIGILEEQKLTYVEKFNFKLPKFNGETILI